MASISTHAGNRTIYVVGPDRRRRPIRLGKCSLKQAQTVRGYVEDLARAATTGSAFSEKTASWLASIGDDLRDKLARAGLIARQDATTIGELIDKYFARRKGSIKPATKVRMEQARRFLVEHLGEAKRLRDVTRGDAEDFRNWLLNTKKLAEATTRRTCGYASAWFNYAVKHDLVRANPFDAVPRAVTPTQKLTYISEEDAQAVSEALPNAEWRLLFALARWGGVRVPSEIRDLTWADIDWARKRLTIKSPKTEHHLGHESRQLPMFPEIAGPLEEVFHAAPEGSVYVLPFVRERTGAALRKPMEKAIKAAGVKPWPRLFHNLRSSRQTDLESRFASHIVCAWLGNSEQIARRHYLQVRDDDFIAALEVVRNPVRAMATDADKARHGTPSDTPQNAIMGQKTLSADMTSVYQVGDTGLEPVTSSV